MIAPPRATAAIVATPKATKNVSRAAEVPKSLAMRISRTPPPTRAMAVIPATATPAPRSAGTRRFGRPPDPDRWDKRLSTGAAESLSVTILIVFGAVGLAARAAWLLSTRWPTVCDIPAPGERID